MFRSAAGSYGVRTKHRTLVAAKKPLSHAPPANLRHADQQDVSILSSPKAEENLRLAIS
jgi:hypothetical protein